MIRLFSIVSISLLFLATLGCKAQTAVSRGPDAGASDEEEDKEEDKDKDKDKPDSGKDKDKNKDKEGGGKKPGDKTKPGGGNTTSGGSGGNATSGSSGDGSPNVDGALSAAYEHPGKIRLTWSEASDDSSDDLEYCVYYSESNNITSKANVVANGTQATCVDALTADVSGLERNKLYYFNVIVKDEEGNSSVYNPISSSFNHVGSERAFLDAIGHSAASPVTLNATQTYYVDATGGNDANDGLSEVNAWASLTEAAQNLVAGDKVLIKNGTYREQVAPANSGTSTQPIIYEAMSGHSPIISGAELVAPETFVALSQVESFSNTPIFSDDFESGALGNYNSTTADAGNTATAASDQSFKGGHAFKATFGGTNKNARVSKNITSTDDVYVRFYLFLYPGFDIDESAKRIDLMLMRLSTTTTRVRVSINESPGGQFYLKSELVTPSSTIYDGVANAGEITTGQWHAIEMRFKGNDASTGGGALWLDGVLKGSNFNLNTSGFSISRVEFGANSSSQTLVMAGSTFYMDNVAISGSEIGAFTSLQPNELFADGLESTDFSTFTSTAIEGTNALTVESDDPLTGSYSAKALFSGDDKAASMRTDFSGGGDIFARGFFKLSPDFDLAQTDQRLDIMVLSDNSGTSLARISLKKTLSGGFMLQADLLQPSLVTFYSGYDGEVSKDVWHAIELRYKGDAASGGGAELWFNGNWLARNEAQDTSGMIPRRLSFGAGAGSETKVTIGSVMRYDDVRVHTRANGLVTTGTPEAVYRASLNWNTNVVEVDGTALYRVLSIEQLGKGSFYNDTVGDYLYIRFPNDDSPTGKVIEVGNRDYTVYAVGKSHLAFKDISFRNANRSGRGSIQIEDGAGIGIYGCRFINNYQMGVLLKNVDDSAIAGNYFEDNREEFGGGIRLEFANRILVEFNTITGRLSSGVMVKGFVNGVTEPSTEITIRRNVIQDIVDAGIYLSYNVSNSEIYENLIRNVRQSTYLTGQNSGGNAIHAAYNSNNNRIHDNIMYQLDTHGVSFRADSTGNVAYNNTIYNVGMKGSGSGLDLHASGGLNPADNAFYNNIVHTATTACIDFDVIDQDNLSDNNLCHNPNYDFGKWDETFKASLAQYRSASGLEENSIEADPLFTDLGDRDFTPLVASPAWGSGRLIP